MAGSDPTAPVAEESTAVADRERRFFDRFVADHGEFNLFADRGWQTLRRRFEALAAPLPTDVLLDVGCGTGQSRRVYAGLVGRSLGVDISPAAVRAARTAFPDDDWHVADACRLPFPDESFDLVAFSSVLHHIHEFDRAVREGFRVLRPGGRAFAFDPNVRHPAMALFRHPASPFYIAQGVSPNEWPLRPVALRRAFRDAGFANIRQRCQSDLPYRRVAPRLMNTLLSVYNVVDRVWERVGLARVFGTFVLTCGTKPVSTP
jgi:ubiquinone/menaquinone biosynthesis C-methylase UbiE